MTHSSHLARLRTLRWTTFLLAALAYVISYFHRVAPGTIAGELQAAFQASSASLGGLAAMYFYVYTVMQIPTGILADTLGPRRILTLGGLVAGAGTLLFAYADTLSVAAAGRTLAGLGVSVTFIAMLKLNAAWFHDRHFGTIVGFVILLGNIGGVLATAPLAEALHYFSWRGIFALLGALSIVLAVLSWFFVRDDPRHAGLPSLRELEGHAAHPPHTGHWFDGLLIVVKNRASWPGFWVTFGYAGSFFAFAGLWAAPYLQTVHGLSRDLATRHTSLLLAGFAIGAMIIGTLSDRIGRRRPVLIGAGVLYLLCWLPLVWALPLPGAASYLLFLLMGLGASGLTLSWACVKEVNPHALSGMSTSVANTGAFLGTGILQPLVGWAIDRAQAAQDADLYQTGMLIFMACVVVGLLGSLRVRETYCRYL